MPVGNIYKIVSQNTNKIYIGSTTETLQKRLLRHKHNYTAFQKGKYHNMSSFELIKLGYVSIELIEEIESNSKVELLKREGYYIKKYRDICVNRCVAGQTRNESAHVYHIRNKSKIHQYKNETLNCSCSKTYTRANKSRHQKTKYHIANFT